MKLKGPYESSGERIKEKTQNEKKWVRLDTIRYGTVRLNLLSKSENVFSFEQTKLIVESRNLILAESKEN